MILLLIGHRAGLIDSLIEKLFVNVCTLLAKSIVIRNCFNQGNGQN